MTLRPPGSRSLVFISHATPQDNDFTLWLGARLASAGYSVWSDVTKLIGGETHWDNIETAIRQHAVKVVSVCSTLSVTKKGFKDELSLALAVERQHDLADFVVPIRLDDLPYSAFPAEIIRRNGIDFGRGQKRGVECRPAPLDQFRLLTVSPLPLRTDATEVQPQGRQPLIGVVGA